MTYLDLLFNLNLLHPIIYCLLILFNLFLTNLSIDSFNLKLEILFSLIYVKTLFLILNSFHYKIFLITFYVITKFLNAINHL